MDAWLTEPCGHHRADEVVLFTKAEPEAGPQGAIILHQDFPH